MERTGRRARHCAVKRAGSEAAMSSTDLTSRTRPAIGLAVVGVGILTNPLDTSVNIALPAIIAAMDQPLSAIQWIVISYILAYASLTMIFGKLGDRLGHRTVFALGLVVSALAFLLCALATRFEWLLAFRALQGLGTAMLISVGPALATQLYPERLRSRILGAYTMVYGLGAAIGPLLGGFLIEHHGWQAVFWFRVPLALLPLLLLSTLPPANRAGPRQPFDLLGGSLLTFSLATALLWLNALRAPGIGTGLATSLLALSVLAGVAFVRVERRAADPIVRPSLFANLDFSLLNVVNLVVNAVNFAVLLFVPFFLTQVLAMPLWLGGLVLAISPLGMMFGGLTGGWLIGPLRPGRLGLGAAALCGLGLLLIGRWAGDTGLAFMAATLFLHGWAHGIFQVVYIDIVTGTLPRDERGVAGSLAMVSRTVGLVAGASVLTLLFVALRDSAATADSAAGEAFVASFRLTFSYAGAALLALLALTLLRPRTWFA